MCGRGRVCVEFQKIMFLQKKIWPILWGWVSKYSRFPLQGRRYSVTMGCLSEKKLLAHSQPLGRPIPLYSLENIETVGIKGVDWNCWNRSLNCRTAVSHDTCLLAGVKPVRYLNIFSLNRIMICRVTKMGNCNDLKV